jgi:hypothetical protein
LKKKKKILNYFYYSLIICFSALIIDGYFQFFFGTNIFGYPKFGVRISSFFGDELILGSYLSRLYPLLFALFLLKEKKKLELYFMSILFIASTGLIYISSERSAFFLHSLSFILIIIFIKQYKKIDYLVVGFNNYNHLKEIIYVFKKKQTIIPHKFSTNYINLIDPRRWN